MTNRLNVKVSSLWISWVAIQYSSTSGVHSLNDKMVQNHLLLGSLNNVLFHSSFCDQSIDIHLYSKIGERQLSRLNWFTHITQYLTASILWLQWRSKLQESWHKSTLHSESLGCSYLFLLANPVSPGLCLQVILRVPVRVKDDHGVCRGQVDPQPSSSCGQQETEVLERKCTFFTWLAYQNVRMIKA